MDLGSKSLKKTKWIGAIIILILVVVLIIVLIPKGNTDENVAQVVPDEEKTKIVSVLDENLKRYSADVSYKIKESYSVNDYYAVVLLDVDGVTYRALMFKDEGNWSVLSYPRLVLSYDDFTEVPEEVLNYANLIGR